MQNFVDGYLPVPAIAESGIGNFKPPFLAMVVSARNCEESDYANRRVAWEKAIADVKVGWKNRAPTGWESVSHLTLEIHRLFMGDPATGI